MHTQGYPLLCLAVKHAIVPLLTASNIDSSFDRKLHCTRMSNSCPLL